MPSQTISMDRKLMREIERYGDEEMHKSFSQSIRQLCVMGLAYWKRERAAAAEIRKAKQ